MGQLSCTLPRAWARIRYVSRFVTLATGNVWVGCLTCGAGPSLGNTLRSRPAHGASRCGTARMACLTRGAGPFLGNTLRSRPAHGASRCGTQPLRGFERSSQERWPHVLGSSAIVPEERSRPPMLRQSRVMKDEGVETVNLARLPYDSQTMETSQYTASDSLARTPDLWSEEFRHCFQGKVPPL